MNETEQREYLTKVENEADFQVRRPSRVESQQFNGLAASTHRVEKKVDVNTGQLVLKSNSFCLNYLAE